MFLWKFFSRREARWPHFSLGKKKKKTTNQLVGIFPVALSFRYPFSPHLRFSLIKAGWVEPQSRRVSGWDAEDGRNRWEMLRWAGGPGGASQQEPWVGTQVCLCLLCWHQWGLPAFAIQSGAEHTEQALWGCSAFRSASRDLLVKPVPVGRGDSSAVQLLLQWFLVLMFSSFVQICVFSFVLYSLLHGSLQKRQQNTLSFSSLNQKAG